MSLTITLFTDPACPFAFSAEPARQRLRWHYGEQLKLQVRMIVLTAEAGEAEKLAGGAPDLQRRYGMPIDPSPLSRPASSEPACRAVVAARLNAPASAGPLLRRLRVHAMLGGLLDDPDLIAQAAGEARLDPADLGRWCESAAVEDALRADMEAARTPIPRLARSTTSSAVRGRSGGTRRRATRSRMTRAGRRSPSPGSTPSRPTRRRSPTSIPG